MASELQRYISDNSLRFFGVSDRSIIDYVVASASSSKSPEALFTALNASGLPDTPDAHHFAQEVFSRAPRKSKAKKSSDLARKQAEEQSKLLHSQKFGFLLDDEAEQARRTNARGMGENERAMQENGRATRKSSRGSGRGRMMETTMTSEQLRKTWTWRRRRMRRHGSRNKG
ncbi:uncharacterized protein B0H18DRAFT_318576 [Fomitopsis serialis]|uniref:uncharacterized protein n=1 Tax=Fomitopsis serialis TaxID=139415 RepID=UPI002007C54A|nr:uncharacterized protein B0H18DRAFT_318576 [Neoantrodia serialis]KAH9936266.1 hypothetical protein B0H18DRAFT_318576 [Neoantrodia serialis]